MTFFVVGGPDDFDAARDAEPEDAEMPVLMEKWARNLWEQLAALRDGFTANVYYLGCGISADHPRFGEYIWLFNRMLLELVRRHSHDLDPKTDKNPKIFFEDFYTELKHQEWEPHSKPSGKDKVITWREESTAWVTRFWKLFRTFAITQCVASAQPVVPPKPSAFASKKTQSSSRVYVSGGGGKAKYAGQDDKKSSHQSHSSSSGKEVEKKSSDSDPKSKTHNSAEQSSSHRSEHKKRHHDSTSRSSSKKPKRDESIGDERRGRRDESDKEEKRGKRDDTTRHERHKSHSKNRSRSRHHKRSHSRGSPKRSESKSGKKKTTFAD
jgi:hypothetical protein